MDRLTTTARALAVAGLSLPIRLYKVVLSPVLPPSCRFQPTCSAYALEALRVHGPIKGVYLAVRRILRCHPITWLGGSSGFDPVPPARTRP
ncbi:MAG TPA: membrane protein insertion efficiency factor YidD [Rhizomicrobium sp.]|nr:membrane protein insertion efficiency factor YidD [Rhizomicrobium sp.]